VPEHWRVEKPRIRDYRDLLVWQKAMDLAVAVEKICDQLPVRASNLKSQMRRSAGSIPANIADGNGRFSRHEYIRFLGIANGSVRELETQLEMAARICGRTEGIEAALKLSLDVVRLLAGLVRALRGKEKSPLP
jgi:four helix bundle protein